MSPSQKRSFWLAIFLLFIYIEPAQTQTGPVLKVCIEGCPYITVQSAIDAAPEGGIVEVAAGEVFTENVTVIGKQNLLIRTSRWEDLPPSGYRIDPVAHGDLLATIRSSNTEPALSIGANENAVAQNGVNIADGTITFEYVAPHSAFSEGSAISCVAFVQNLGSLPAPMVYGRKYWIRDWNAEKSTGKIAETPAGPALELTSTGSASARNYYARPLCVLWDQSRQITLQGIRFDNKPGVSTFALVQVGHNVEADRKEMGPAEIAFRHTVISGVQDDPTGPRVGLSLNGYEILLRDSWIGHCKATREESKAIAVGNVSGASIINNYLSAASINLLTAGSDSAAMDVNRDLVITGNFFDKPGYMMYKEGAGAPAGECYHGSGSGAFYRRTDVTPNTCADGACYTCGADNRWRQDNNAFYRNGHYLSKNMLEVKDCENCRIEGNYMQGGYGGPDVGQGWCFGISVIISRPGFSGGGSGYHRAHNVTFRNNWADSCYSGVFMAHSAYGGTFENVPMKDIVFENNLLSNLGWYPAMTQFSDPDSVLRFGLKQSTGINGFRFLNNTLRAKSDYRVGVVLVPGSYSDRRMLDYHFENNLMSYKSYSFLLDSMTNGCSADGLFQWIPNDGRKHFRNNVFFGGEAPNTFLASSNCNPIAENTLFETSDAKVGFLSATDHRLSASSRYSAANLSVTLNSALNVTGIGPDLGADIDMIEQYALPAQRGEPSMPEQLALKVTSDTHSAQIRFRPPGGDSCRVTLYSSRTRLLRDVIDAKIIEGRKGERVSPVGETLVQFGMGVTRPLSPQKKYHYRVDCGSLWTLGSFETTTSRTGEAQKR